MRYRTLKSSPEFIHPWYLESWLLQLVTRKLSIPRKRKRITLSYQLWYEGRADWSHQGAIVGCPELKQYPSLCFHSIGFRNWEFLCSFTVKVEGWSTGGFAAVTFYLCAAYPTDLADVATNESFWFQLSNHASCASLVSFVFNWMNIRSSIKRVRINFNFLYLFWCSYNFEYGFWST